MCIEFSLKCLRILLLVSDFITIPIYCHGKYDPFDCYIVTVSFNIFISIFFSFNAFLCITKENSIKNEKYILEFQWNGAFCIHFICTVLDLFCSLFQSSLVELKISVHEMTYRNLVMYRKCFMYCDILIYSYSMQFWRIARRKSLFFCRFIVQFAFLDFSWTLFIRSF